MIVKSVQGRSIKVGRICWKGRFWAWSERVKEWRMMRVVMMTEMSWQVSEEVHESRHEFTFNMHKLVIYLLKYRPDFWNDCCSVRAKFHSKDLPVASATRCKLPVDKSSTLPRRSFEQVSVKFMQWSLGINSLLVARQPFVPCMTAANYDYGPLTRPIRHNSRHCPHYVPYTYILSHVRKFLLYATDRYTLRQQKNKAW